MPEDGGDVEIEEFAPDQMFPYSQNLTPKQRNVLGSRRIWKPWLYYSKLNDSNFRPFRLPGPRVLDLRFYGFRISVFRILDCCFLKSKDLWH